MKPKYSRVVSDLHLEQYQGMPAEALRIKFIPPHENDRNSILVLAGDISSKPTQLLEFLREVEKFFLHVIYVPGNHEFYGHRIDVWSENLKAALKSGPFDDPENPKISFATIHMEYKEFENVRFIFGTLWGDGGKSLKERALVGDGLRDFYVVKTKGEERFTVPAMMDIHGRQKKQLQEFLKKPFDGVTIVVSHHMPSYRLCHPRFGTTLNGGFASDCDSILAADNAPDVWIHGHTHDSIDGRYWNTRVVCNPSGYYYENDVRFKVFRPVFIDLENPKNDDRDMA